MAKKILMFIGITFCLVFFCLSQSYGQESLVKQEAADLIDHYFFSLKNGYNKQLLYMLTGSLKQERKNALMNNLQYPEFLKEINADAEYRIVGMNYIDEDTINVEVLFTRAGVSQKLIFLLVRENGILKISDEQVVP